MEDFIKQVKSDNEDIKFKLDAILNAIIIPQLGKNKKEIKEKILKTVRGELAQKIWNSIDGERSVPAIAQKLNRKHQVVIRYINRWEQETPPLVYICMVKEGARIYKRVFELKIRKPKNDKKPKPSSQKVSSEQEKGNLKQVVNKTQSN